MIRTFLLLLLPLLACAQGTQRPQAIVLQEPSTPLVFPDLGTIHGSNTTSGTITLTPGTATSPRLVRIDGVTANETNRLDMVAGDDVDDIIQFRMMRDSLDQGVQLAYVQADDEFRIEDGFTSDVRTIWDLDTGNVSFLGLPNFAMEFSLVAGDSVNDFTRLRFIDSNGTDGWQITWNQALSDEPFLVEEIGGLPFMQIAQDTGNTSFLGPAQGGVGATRLSMVTRDLTDDDVYLQLVNTSDDGYRLQWDQSLDDLIFENATGTNILKLDNTSIVAYEDFLPVGDNTLDLGFTGASWANIDFDGEIRGSGTVGKDWLPDGDDTRDLGSGANSWANFEFDGEIRGNGTVGMDWVPDGDGTRTLGDWITEWENVFSRGVEVKESDGTLKVKLDNTTMAYQQVTVSDGGGTLRAGLGVSGSDAGLNLLGDVNVFLGTNNAAGNQGLSVGGNRVVGEQCSSLPADATDLSSAITLVNAIKDCINENNHGLADGT